MTPTHATKAGKRYRYYVNGAIAQGISLPSDAVRRVPAPELERAVIDAIRTTAAISESDDATLIADHLDRAEINPGRLVVRLRRNLDEAAQTIELDWTAPTQVRHRAVMVPADQVTSRQPMRADTRATLLTAIAKGKRWLSEMITGVVDQGGIAAREGCSIRQVNRTVSLAFLAPDIVQAAIEGRLPAQIGVIALSDLPTSWARQRQHLGLPSGR